MRDTPTTLFGPSRVQLAIDRLREFEPDDGYYVAFSGGKDSQVVLDLVRRSGVKHDAHMNVTTVDPPELMRFVRQHYGDVAMERPGVSMYQLIQKKRMPPTRKARFCCDVLKERGGEGRVVVTGIRWAESSRRAQRSMVEKCLRRSTITYVNPIIEWSDADVWQYLNERGLPHCSLYDEGYKRIGCVMCPMQSPHEMRRDAERWPKFAAMYRRACCRVYEDFICHKDDVKWRSGDDVYEWWTTKHASARDHEPQLFPLDN